MVEIRNLTKTVVSSKLLLEAANKVLDGEKRHDVHISVALLNPPIIQYLNKRYRNDNRVTDVLAFSQADVVCFEPPEALPPNYLGEVAICLEQVERNARGHKEPFIKELIRVFTHGILHLLGYDHEDIANDKGNMKKKEDRYLADFFSLL